LALVQEVVGVRADGIHDAEPLVAQVRHGDRAMVDHESSDLALRNIGDSADLHERHPRAPPANSSAIAVSAPNRTSSVVTRSKTSWKNPVTMRGSGSARGRPRLCR